MCLGDGVYLSPPLECKFFKGRDFIYFVYYFVPVSKIFSRNICGKNKYVSSRLLTNVCLIKFPKAQDTFSMNKKIIFLFLVVLFSPLQCFLMILLIF